MPLREKHNDLCRSTNYLVCPSSQNSVIAKCSHLLTALPIKHEYHKLVI